MPARKLIDVDAMSSNHQLSQLSVMISFAGKLLFVSDRTPAYLTNCKLQIPAFTLPCYQYFITSSAPSKRAQSPVPLPNKHSTPHRHLVLLKNYISSLRARSVKTYRHHLSSLAPHLRPLLVPYIRTYELASGPNPSFKNRL